MDVWDADVAAVFEPPPVRFTPDEVRELLSSAPGRASIVEFTLSRPPIAGRAILKGLTA